MRQRNEQIARDRKLPDQPPTLSYDIVAVSRLEPDEDQSIPVCERLSRWQGYVAELPTSERERYARLNKELSARDLELEYNSQGDPYFCVQMASDRLRAAAVAEATALLDHRDIQLQETATDDLEKATSIYQCAGTLPPARLVAELDARRAHDAEESRCAATPACVAERKRERIAQLRDFMCEAEGDRQDAKAGIREEWRAAHETGLVDLQNLSDHRTLMEIHEGQIADHAEEWKELTGKAWNAKRVCGQAAR